MSDSNEHIYQVIIAVLVLIIIGVVAIPKEKPSDHNPPTQTKQVEEKPKFKTITLSGSDTQLTKPFHLDDGGYKVTSKNVGGMSNFIVLLVDTQGNELDAIANEIGTTDISSAIKADEGTYYFKVDSDGSWTIKVEPL